MSFVYDVHHDKILSFWIVQNLVSILIHLEFVLFNVVIFFRQQFLFKIFLHLITFFIIYIFCLPFCLLFSLFFVFCFQNQKHKFFAGISFCCLCHSFFLIYSRQFFHSLFQNCWIFAQSIA